MLAHEDLEQTNVLEHPIMNAAKSASYANSGPRTSEDGLMTK